MVSSTLIVPMLRVGMQPVTLRVTCAVVSRARIKKPLKQHFRGFFKPGGDQARTGCTSGFSGCNGSNGA